ncbi:MAG: M18 family aminopeptidase [Polyangiaceae bacterium]|nr:M18 family aminopeptidase [Polyangiaceae bacterium]
MDALRASGVREAKDLGELIDRSPTPFHAAAEVASRLKAAGFQELSEREPWVVAPGDRRFFVRGGSTIVAFVAGSEPPAKAGFKVIGAHTDSPGFRLKPLPDVNSRGYQQLGVEVYGGVLFTTWLDRDLSIAGRVLFDRGGSIEARLVDLVRPVARIPNLAIHLNRQVNTEGLVLNAQKHLVPLVGLGKEAVLKSVIARELGEKAEALAGFDLCLYDTAKASVGGLENEFIFTARLDNLGSSHAAMRALIKAADTATPATRVIVLYDHEECGSRSFVGAGGPVLRDTLERLVDALPDGKGQGLARAVAGSFLISADMAHAVHPNYADQHEPLHAPQLNRGLVIKSNSNQSYATDGASGAVFEALCRKVGYSPQRFVTRSDLPCGSTIGPITAAKLGIPTVDVGAPMLSMHSCREMAGTLDVHLAIETYAQSFL